MLAAAKGRAGLAISGAAAGSPVGPSTIPGAGCRPGRPGRPVDHIHRPLDRAGGEGERADLVLHTQVIRPTGGRLHRLQTTHIDH